MAPEQDDARFADAVSRCPECGSFDSERVETCHGSREVEVVYACNECYAGWIGRFGLLETETTHASEVPV